MTKDASADAARLERERNRERKHVAQLMRDLEAARKRAEQAEASLTAFRANHRGNYDAFTAMRNDINEIVGDMPSQEAVLANGPDWSHDCAAVVEAVRKFADEAREALDWSVAEIEGSTRYDRAGQRENALSRAKETLAALSRPVEGVKIGDRAFFEYFCHRAHDSAHARHWYHSHQWVEVLAVTEEGSGDTMDERGENGEPRCYRVRWADGFQADVFEHELYSSPRDVHQPIEGAPPPFASHSRNALPLATPPVADSEAPSTPVDGVGAEPAAWQVLVGERWINLPEDWSADINLPGRQYRPLYAAPLASPEAEPLPDDSPRATLFEIGNQIHNIGCEVQNDEQLSARLADLRDRIWAAARLASPEAEALRERVADEISPYEWMAQEFDRLAILRKMWSAQEVAATLRRYDIERPAAEARLAQAEQSVCPTCRGDGNDVTGVYDHCQNCGGSGRLAQAERGPAVTDFRATLQNIHREIERVHAESETVDRSDLRYFMILIEAALHPKSAAGEEGKP